MLFRRQGNSFRVCEKRGYVSAEFEYAFLGEAGSWQIVFREGYAAVSGASPEFRGRSVWVAVDRLQEPGYMLVAEVDGDGPEVGPVLRQALVLDIALRKENEISPAVEDLPVWLADLLPDMLGRPSPMLLVAEPGSGKEELVLACLRARYGGEASGVFFHPGRLSQAVQLRELFGDPAGARLGGPGPVIPIVQRQEPVVVIQEAADLAPHAQLRLLAHFSSGQNEQFWIFETSRDLKRMAQAERFLPGLYRMLESNILQLPPVRVSRTRLAEEAHRLMEGFRARYHREVELADNALDAMARYGWPGNWRELKNTLESAFLMASGGRIDAQDLRLGLWTSPEDWDDLNLRKRSREMEKSLLLRAYALHGGNQVHMARALGISRGSLQYKLEKYGMN